MVEADPPVRADGRCATCFGQRKTDRSKKYGRDEAERDPFCSSLCARIFHGTQLRAIIPGPKKAKP